MTEHIRKLPGVRHVGSFGEHVGTFWGHVGELPRTHSRKKAWESINENIEQAHVFIHMHFKNMDFRIISAMFIEKSLSLKNMKNTLPLPGPPGLPSGSSLGPPRGP